MTVEYKFPEGFWWGTATSGPQSEGAADIDPLIELVAKNPLNNTGTVQGTDTPVVIGTNPVAIEAYATPVDIIGANTQGITIIGFKTIGKPNITGVAYASMATGLVPMTTGVSVPWTEPVLLSGFLATNSIRGSIIIDCFLYYKFLIYTY